MQRHIRKAIDEQAGVVRPIVIFAVGGEQYHEMKKMVAKKLIERLPDTLMHVERYAGEAMDIRNTLVTKMQQLTPTEFEGLLRPAFQQDEWILIMVGAVLGFMVGEFQVFMMTH